MASSDDLYAALMGEPVNTREKQAAIADLLRRRAGFAGVAQLTGDPALAPMGEQQAQQTQQQAQMLGQNARAAQQAQLQQQQEARIAAGQQQQMDLTRRGQDLDYQAALASTMAHLKAAQEKPAAQPTESERKNATLAARLEGSLRTLEGITEKEQTPGLLERGLETVGVESLANLARSEDRQRADAAQRDALDAALTLSTGASYTKEQLEGQRKAHFPQINDTPKVIAEKRDRLMRLVASARAAAGRAEGNVDAALAAAPPKRRKFNLATGKIE